MKITVPCPNCKSELDISEVCKMGSKINSFQANRFKEYLIRDISDRIRATDVADLFETYKKGQKE